MGNTSISPLLGGLKRSRFQVISSDLRSSDIWSCCFDLYITPSQRVYVMSWWWYRHVHCVPCLDGHQRNICSPQVLCRMGTLNTLDVFWECSDTFCRPSNLVDLAICLYRKGVTLLTHTLCISSSSVMMCCIHYIIVVLSIWYYHYGNTCLHVVQHM